MARLLIVIAVAFVIVSATMGWMWQVYIPRAPLIYLFLGMTPVLKLLTVVIVILTGVGAVGGLTRNVERVWTTAISTVALGALGAFYGELNTHFGVLIDNEITFATLAPMRIESLAILALGLFGGVLALCILQLRGGVRPA